MPEPPSRRERRQIWMDEFELFQQPPAIVFDLPDRGLLMDAPLSPLLVFEVFDGVGDIGIRPLDTRGLECLIEKPASRADERMTLAIFLVARLFADQCQRRADRTFAEHSLQPTMHHRLGGSDHLVHLGKAHRFSTAFHVEGREVFLPVWLVHDSSRHAGITHDLAFSRICVAFSLCWKQLARTAIRRCSFRFFYCNRVTVL